jgi:hypothetical protein
MNWKDLTGDLPETHDFEKEKVLQGVLVEKQAHVGANDSYVFTFEKEDTHDKVAVWGSAVLDKINNLPIGTLVRIEYLGQVKGKRGTFFKNYKIQFDQDTRPEDDLIDMAQREFGN